MSKIREAIVELLSKGTASIEDFTDSDILDFHTALLSVRESLTKAPPKPNVGGYPIPTEDKHKDHMQAKQDIKNFMSKWGDTVANLKGGNMVHPDYIDAYSKERDNLKVPMNFKQGDIRIPPKIGESTRNRMVEHFKDKPKPTDLKPKAEPAPKKDPPTLNYSKMGKPKPKSDEGAPSINYANFKTNYDKIEREAPTYNKETAKITPAKKP
jgi:hypothetical protein